MRRYKGTTWVDRNDMVCEWKLAGNCTRVISHHFLDLPAKQMRNFLSTNILEVGVINDSLGQIQNLPKRPTKQGISLSSSHEAPRH